jgi:hypothetical protein
MSVNEIFKFKYVVPAFLGLWPLTITTSDIGWITALTGVWLFYRMGSFLDSFGKRLGVLDLVEVMAVLQLVYAPAMHYLIHEYNLVRWVWWWWVMAVPYKDYFMLAIPSTMAFVLGMRIFAGDIKKFSIIDTIKRIRENDAGNFTAGLIIFSIGFAGTFLSTLGMGAFDFLFTLLSSLLYVGLLYLYFSKSPARNFFVIFGFLVVGYKSLSEGMFGTAIWIPMFLMMVILPERKVGYLVKWVMFVTLLIVFGLLQSVKADYREKTWSSKGKTEGKSNTGVLTDLLDKKTGSDNFSIMDLNNYYPLISRLNQGFHVAGAMRYTPDQEPFAFGETITTTVAAIIIPRLFWADKPEAGGRAYYQRFVGYKLASNVSMNIGQLGEAYVNFNTSGAPFCMFAYGLIISLFCRYCVNRAKRIPIFLIWMPLLLIHLISVESDFFYTLNSIFKSIIFMLVLFAFMKKSRIFGV